MTEWGYAVQTKRFTIDESAASVVFIASSSVHPIRSVGSMSGWIDAVVSDTILAEGQELGGHLEVPLNGLSSGNPLVDREMKRRVDYGLHPAIIARLEETLRVDGNRATITGTIDFLGASTLVEGEVVILPGPRLVGAGEFDVRWWGLEPPRLLMLQVDPIVTVEIDAPLVEQP
jgi:hypothetical protein